MQFGDLSLEKEPDEQVRQVLEIEPIDIENVPALHEVHPDAFTIEEEEPAFSDHVPGGQGYIIPFVQYEPALQ